MTDRRRFLKASILGASASMLARVGKRVAGLPPRTPPSTVASVVSTWDFGIAAKQVAWAIFGKGGYPDHDGQVIFDGSMMDADDNCGAFAAREHIEHPISLARRLMERTSHRLLVGEGALQFALEQRIVRKRREASKTLPVGVLAMNRAGAAGVYAIQHGLSYAGCDAQKRDGLIPALSVYTTSYS